MDFNTSLWRSHRKGDRTRAKILELKQQNPNISLAELALATGVNKQQIKRQISRLYADGLLAIAA